MLVWLSNLDFAGGDGTFVAVEATPQRGLNARPHHVWSPALLPFLLPLLVGVMEHIVG